MRSATKLLLFSALVCAPALAQQSTLPLDTGRVRGILPRANGGVGMSTAGLTGCLAFTSSGVTTALANCPPLLQTNGTSNPSQTILNLIPGPNITLTPDANGGVTIAGGGSSGTAAYAYSSFPTNLAAGTLILQTDASESGTCGQGGGSTYRLCRSLGVSAGFAIADDETPAPIAALWEAGDSFAQCWGATNPTATCAMAMLAANTPAIPYNIGTGGYTQGQTSASFFFNFFGDSTLPSAIVQIGGANDGLHDSCGGTTTSGCAYNFKLMLDADIAWGSIPTPFRQMASTGTGTGWTADTTTIPIFASSILASPGTPMKSSTTAPLTINLPSSTSTVVGITYPATNSSTALFNVSIDSLPRVDATTGTTTFSSGPAQGAALYGVTSAPFRQYYTVTPGAHTVVITPTSTAQVGIISADYLPPPATPNTNHYFFVGPNAYYQYAAAYDTMASQVVAAENAAGLASAVYVSQINGTPGVNALTTAGGDLAQTASTTLPATTASGHPSDGGQKNLLKTIENAETASGFRFSRHRRNESAVPYFEGPPTILTYSNGNLPNLGQSFSFENTGTLSPYGHDLFRKSNNRLGDGYSVDTSTGQPWSGAYTKMVFSSIPGSFWCVDSLAQGGTLTTSQIPASSYACKFAVRFADGVAFGPQFITTSSAPAASLLGVSVASATTIALTGTIQHVTLTNPIATITPPANFSLIYGGCANLIADAAWTTTTAGNIFAAMTATPGTRYLACFDGLKWYIN